MILDSEECFSVPINILRRVPFSNISHQRCHLNKLVKSKEEMATKRMTELNPWPSYIQDRIELWDKFHAKYKQQLAEKQLDTIKITLPNGEVRDGQAWCTTPYQIAQEISQDLADNALVAKVDDVLWDLDRPLESSCDLQLLNFDCEEGQQVFWHSSAHIVGEAMERVYGGWLCCGPPIDSGFYYDMYLEDRCISSSDFPFLQNVIKSIVKEKQPFERLELPKEDLLEMFKYNPFKVYTLKEKVKTPTTTVYRCGPMIDLCCGPHVRHTGKVKALQITKNSSTFWEGSDKTATLQRIYGISFPKMKWLKEWQKFQETAVKKDHRKIGKEQELFFFHELSPGSCFFQPLGTLIYNNLLDFIRSEYRKRGFQEVISPNIFNCKLWKTSGHWPYYSENMFSFEFEKVKYALKPMNCPGHCLMFDHRPRSWRELPLRIADFGVLHRNEFSGTLSGLMRVRRFQQDDAHIFCAVNQIAQEIEGALSFLQDVYSVFGFTFQLKLATRPDYFLGELDMWNQAEKQLQESLENFGQQWTLNPGDGAFYGPKIDITIMDALKRPHQCATIQLDFQLPVRFNLFYISESGEKKQPVIIHRAVLGSVERMIAILAENFSGRWPFWLSPRQAIVISVGPSFDDYAKQVRDEIRNGGFLCEADLDEGTTLSKKIRNAQLAQFNFIFVVGEREKTSETVNVRTRDNRVHGEYSLKEVMSSFKKLKDQKVINSEDVFQT